MTNLLSADVYGNRDSGDEADEFPVRLHSDSNMPFLVVSRRFQCPEKHDINHMNLILIKGSSYHSKNSAVYWNRKVALSSST